MEPSEWEIHWKLFFSFVISSTLCTNKSPNKTDAHPSETIYHWTVIIKVPVVSTILSQQHVTGNYGLQKPYLICAQQSENYSTYHSYFVQCFYTSIAINVSLHAQSTTLFLLLKSCIMYLQNLAVNCNY